MIAHVIALGVVLVGCSVSKDPMAEARKPKPIQVFVASEITIAHPSVTGSVSANEIDAPKYNRHAGQSDRWMSLTELSSERVCVDLGFYVVNTGEKNGDLDHAIEQERTIGYWLRSGTQERRLAIAQQAANRVLDRRQGKYKDFESRETGRTTTECVEQLENQYGTVVGCSRYEQRPQVERVEVLRDGEIVTRFGGLRVCTPNDGFVAPDATALEVSFAGKVSGGRGMVHRIALTGGVKASGRWGGTGGRSGLEPPEVGSVASAKGATPADELRRHATGKLELRAFKVVEPDGTTEFEFTADGKLFMHDKLVATYQSDGIIRDKSGRAFVALDASGVIWVLKSNTNRIDEHAKIKGNKLELSTRTFTYDRGRFSSTSPDGLTIKYASRIVPAIPAPLALYFIGTQNPNHFTKEKPVNGRR